MFNLVVLAQLKIKLLKAFENMAVSSNYDSSSIKSRLVPREGEDLISFVYDHASYLSSQNIQYIVPKGILYKIKDASGDTIGYLMSSCHASLPDWESLPDQVITALQKSNKVFFENRFPDFLVTIPVSAACRMMVDFAVLQQANGKDIVYLEESTSFHFDDPELDALTIANYRSLRAWEEGDEKWLLEEHKRIHDCFVSKNRWHDFYCLSGKRTKKWFDNQLCNELQTASKANKFFICVGFAHTVDICGGADFSCNTCSTSNLGLRTLFEQAGYSLNKLSSRI